VQIVGYINTKIFEKYQISWKSV